MTKSQAWIKALRFRTLPLSLSGIILGSFIAKYNGFWDWNIFILAIITTVFFQIVSNLANDLGDSIKGTDNANRVGPVRSVQSGVISKKEMKTAIIIGVILSCVSSGTLIYLGTKDLPQALLWFYIGLAVCCVVAALTYTLGKKAYGYLGLGDIMVFLFFGIVSVLGVYPLFTKSIDWNLILPASSIGLLSAAVLNLNNMRDRINDAKSGKNTLAVKLGPNGSKFYHAIIVLGGITCQALFIVKLNHNMAFIGISPGIILFIHVRKVMETKNPKDFDPELLKVSLSTFGIAVLTSIGLMIS